MNVWAIKIAPYKFLALDVFFATSCCAIETMFICLSVCLSGTGMHYDHAVQL